jgi:phenylacetic acid degradation protein
MSFVKEGTQVPPRVLVAGVPARVVRELTGTEIAWKSNGTLLYQELAQRSREEMRECLPLAAVEPGRPVREAGSRPLSETRGEAT